MCAIPEFLLVKIKHSSELIGNGGESGRKSKPTLNEVNGLPPRERLPIYLLESVFSSAPLFLQKLVLGIPAQASGKNSGALVFKTTQTLPMHNRQNCQHLLGL